MVWSLCHRASRVPAYLGKGPHALLAALFAVALAGCNQNGGQSLSAAQPRGATIAFESIDEVPVDLMFVLLAPDTAGADHLKALARVSRLLRDKAMCEKLRATDNADAIYALLTEATASHAA